MSEKQTSRRFYVVTEKSDGAQCLVEAATKASALSRSAAFYCDVRIAQPGDIIDMMKRGADIIEIEPDAQLDLPLPDDAGEDPKPGEIV